VYESVVTAGAWQPFYLMIGGAAAALTGLIFVAISIRSRAVMATVLQRDRAFASQAMLLSQVVLAAAALVPSQSVAIFGLEVEAVAAFWAYRTAKVILVLGPAMRTAGRPTRTWRLEWGAWLVWLVALVAGGLGLLGGDAVTGFDLVAIAMAGMLAFAVWNAWVLVAEVPDEATGG
jgi:hypothetical protein